MSVLDEINIENTNLKSVHDYLDRLKENMNIVSSIDYLNWLDGLFNRTHLWYVDDESIYDENKTLTEVDKFNIKLLSYFQSYVEGLFEKQKIEPIASDKYFCDFEYIFSFNNRYYKIFTEHGQGSVTTVQKYSTFPILENNKLLMLPEERKTKMNENNCVSTPTPVNTKTKWHNVITDKDYPAIGEKVLVATLYIEDGKFVRDYNVASYHGNPQWDGTCDTDIVTHWQNINKLSENERLL